jgi:uncharacterized membrane protein YkoI
MMIRLLAAALIFSAPSAEADDHGRARRAVEQGEALPLATLLPDVEARLGARVIEVGFDRDDGRYVYEFELIDPAGRIIEATVDAETGVIREVEVDD